VTLYPQIHIHHKRESGRRAKRRKALVTSVQAGQGGRFVYSVAGGQNAERHW